MLRKLWVGSGFVLLLATAINISAGHVEVLMTWGTAAAGWFTLTLCYAILTGSLPGGQR